MPLLILLVVVIVVGVVIAVRGGTATGRGSTLGLWCLASGLVAWVGVAMIGQATFGWAPAFDPQGWLRVVTIWLFPMGVAASAILGALSLKRESVRTPAIVGLILAALSVVAFIAMQVSVDY